MIAYAGIRTVVMPSALKIFNDLLNPRARAHATSGNSIDRLQEEAPRPIPGEEPDEQAAVMFTGCAIPGVATR